MVTNNPLSKYFRQPALYTTLPSGGQFYNPGSMQFDNTETNELAVYPMTAKDEMIMNTPDALLNGDATVAVIQSCVPGIKDAWDMPIMDMDTVLIAMRVATYGHDMEINITVPKVEEQMNYTIDLRTATDTIDRTKFDDYVPAGSLSFKIKPMTYRQLTNLQLKQYEQQRIITQVIEAKLNPADKQAKFNEIFTNMTDITLQNMKDTIVSVQAEGKEITDRNYINEFVDNMDGQTAQSIKNCLDTQKAIGKIKPVKVSVPEEMVQRGAPKSIETPISMDQSNFFVSRS